MSANPFSHLKFITRRAALRAGVFLPFSAPLGARSIDPHPVWLSEWRAQREKLAQLLHVGREHALEGAHIHGAMASLEQSIAQIRARTLEGVSAQLDWVLDDGRDHIACDVHKDALSAALRALGGEGAQ